MLYLWEEPANTRNRDIGEYNRKVSPDRFMLRAGQMLSNEEFTPIPEVHFEISKERVLKFDSLPNNASAPLVNQRIKTILETVAPKDVQFFKARLICKDGTLDNYYFLNVTHTIVGIDHEKSVYKKMEMAGTSWIGLIHHLSYKHGCMGKYDLARDEEYKGHILVSEKIKNIFDKEKVTGVWLVRPEDYYNGPLTAEALINEERAIEEESEEDD